jgi:hypothetical protein
VTVLDEIGAGDRVGLTDAGRERGVSGPTVFRWATRGCRAADGTRVRLEYARIGGRLLTSRAALDRFLVALNSPPEPSATSNTPARRSRAAVSASAELEREGW